MDASSIKRLTYLVNTAILIMVFGLMAFFIFAKAKFLVYFSFPTILIYIIGYIMISRDKLFGYVIMVYVWITIYMSFCTVCLGYDYGFHLYGMSMIPIIFYTEYMAYKLGRKSIRGIRFSLFIVGCYLVSTLSPSIFGPIYTPDVRVARAFWVVNSIIVFGFLIFYTNVLIKGTINSEKSLKDQAHRDNLTKLYNRHYMGSKLDAVEAGLRNTYISMVDIDKFKNINDVYGHNAGDMVLKKVAEVMTEVCDKSIISRWGGEEFLLLTGADESSERLTDKTMKEYMEKLRTSIEATDFEYENQHIKVTVTIGVSAKQHGEKIEKWVDEADDKLYAGKNSGRNRVII